MFFFHLIFIIIVFFLSHPIRLRISLILIAILARIISLWINSSWFFYLIVLVFLGGVIILIIYIRTLAANEKFRRISINYNTIGIILMVRLSILVVLKYKNILQFIRRNNTAVGIIYEASNFSLLLFLITYLLLTLVCVVKLVKFESGPLIKRL